MTRHVSQRRRGQAIVMVTLALIAMFGIIGLAVDLGWSYFTRKSQRAAAEAGALAAVKAALDTVGPSGTYTCGGPGATCAATPVACPGATGNLTSACMYASLDGFTPDANTTVTVQASDRSTAPTVTGCNPLVHHPPTAPCVETPYWVTVRVSQTVPQLFSGVLGNSMGTVSVRATAAVAKSLVIGSLILLNRENDTWIGTKGTNLYLGGGPSVNVPGGILMASNGKPAQGSAASVGYIQGNGTVTSPFTYVRSGGCTMPDCIHLGGAAQWNAPPSLRPDSSSFEDPYQGYTQPPINPTTNNVPVPNGSLNSNVCTGNVCQPGNYYAVDARTGLPTGGRLAISDGIRFSSGTNGFGTYVFFGGLSVSQATVTFDPAEYVLAGANSGELFSMGNKAVLLGGNSNDAGRMFILTNSSYGGALSPVTSSIPGLPSFNFGTANFQTGNNSGSKLTMYGLNPNSSALPAGMSPWAPVAVWQDRANSSILLNPDGTLNLSCSGNATVNNPCPNLNQNSPELKLQATPDTQWAGVIYQPRGAWTAMQASGNYQGPLQLITGAMELQGNGNLTLSSPSNPVERFVAALVE